jgi:ABC-2 type transport system permease protein
MTRALRAEWTKLRSVPSSNRALVATFLLTIVFSALIAASSSTEGGCGNECDDVVANALGGVYLGQFAVVALAVMAMSSEYATGLIRVTFTAEPRRRLVLIAKTLAVAGAVLVVGVLAALAAFEIGTAISSGNGYAPRNGYPDWSLSDGPVQRAIVGTGLYLAALALFSLGVAALFRSTAAAISTVVAVLFVPIIVASVTPRDVADHVLQVAPMTAGLSVQRTVEGPDTVPIDPWVGLGVMALWAAAAMAAALWLIARRDA